MLHNYNNRTSETFISYKPNGVCLYERSDSGYLKSKQNEVLQSNIKKHIDTGLISEPGRKKIQNTINWYAALIPVRAFKHKDKKIKYKLTFATITLPSKQLRSHSDQYVKKNYLNQFLIEIRQKYGIEHYIWRAERQKNKNIHFHILFDRFIDWQVIRKVWNRVVEKDGYVSRYQKKQKAFFKNGFRVSTNPLDKRTVNQQQKAYDNNVICNFKNPNSTDIHSVANVNNLGAYIGKYMAKKKTKEEEENGTGESYQAISGRLWYRSKALKVLTECKKVATEREEEELQKLFELYPERVIVEKYFSFFRFTFSELKELGKLSLLGNVIKHCKDWVNGRYEEIKLRNKLYVDEPKVCLTVPEVLQEIKPKQLRFSL